MTNPIPLAVPEHRRARARARARGGRLRLRLLGRAVRVAVRAGVRRRGRRAVRGRLRLRHGRDPRRRSVLLGVGAGRPGRGVRLHLRRLVQPGALPGRRCGAGRLGAADLEPRPAAARRLAGPAAPRRAGALPKVVEVVHALGQPARLAEVVEICAALRHPGPRGRCRVARRDLVVRRPGRPGHRRGRAGSARSPSTATRSPRPAAAACWSPTTRRWPRGPST